MMKLNVMYNNDEIECDINEFIKASPFQHIISFTHSSE